MVSIVFGIGLVFHGSDEFYHGAYTAIDGEIHRNWTAQWLDQYTGSEFWSDIIDGAIGIFLSFGARAPATVGRHALQYGFRKVGKELTEAGIRRAGPAAKFLEKQAAALRGAVKGPCFIAGTMVHIPPELATNVTIAGPSNDEGLTSSWDTSSILLAAGTIPIALLGYRKLKRKKKKVAQYRQLDDLFANDLLDDLWCGRRQTPVQRSRLSTEKPRSLSMKSSSRLNQSRLNHALPNDPRGSTSVIDSEPIVRDTQLQEKTRMNSTVKRPPVKSVAKESSRVGLVWLTMWLTLGGMLFWQAAQPTSAKTIAPTQAATATRVIEEFRPGQRVKAHNPELGEMPRDWADPQPETSRLITLRQRKADGSSLDFQLVRSVDWLETLGGHVGGSIELNMTEMGAVGPTEVIAVDPCPEFEPGDDPLVTGTFRHTANNIVDVTVKGLDKPITCTDQHPFWSEDRQAFIPASALKPEERIRTVSGSVAVIDSITPRDGPQTVYNIEVQGEHAYYVSSLGLLVHNGSAVGGNAPNSAVRSAGESAKRFLGKDYRVITNKAGDKIFLSKDGTKRIRFDINRPHPHKNPHSHVEELINGKWRGRRIYPTDVIPE